MDYDTQFISDKPKIPKNVANERAAIFSITDDVNKEDAAIDLEENGSDSLTQKTVEDRVDLEKDALYKQAVTDVVTSQDVDEETKIDVLSTDRKKEPLNYAEILADKLRVDITGLSRKELNIALNKKLAEFDTDIITETKKYNKRKYDTDRAITSQLASDAQRRALSQVYVDGKGVTNVLSDFAGEMIPLNTQQIWIGLYENMFNKSIDLEKTVLVGRLQEELKDEIKKLPLSERGAFMTKATQWIVDNSGFRDGDNDLQSIHIVNDLLEDALTGEENNVSEWFNSLIGVLDSTQVGSIAVGMVKSTFKGVNSVLFKTMIGTSTKKAKELAKAISDNRIDPSDIGVDGNLLDAATISSVDSMPNAISDQLNNAKNIAETVAEDLAHNTLMHSDDNLDLLRNDYKKVLDTTFKTVQKSEIQLKDIKQVEDDLEVSFTVSNTDTHGFDSLYEAMDDAKKYSSNAKMKMKMENGEYLYIDDLSKDIKGDFFYELNHKMSKSDIARSTTAKITSEDFNLNSLPPFLHKWFTDSTNGLAPRLSQAIDSSLDMSEGAQSALKKILVPFLKISAKSQHKVVSAINETIKQKKDITWDLIDSLPLSGSEKSAMWSFKLTNEALHITYNSRLRRGYVADGVRKVEIPYVDGEGNSKIFKAYGNKVDQKELPSIDGNVTYYDYATDSLVKLNKAELDQVYGNGGFLVRVKEDLGDAKNVSNYVMGGIETSLKDLPRNLLNHKNSYGSARYNTSKIYIREKRSIVRNGKKEEYYTAREGVETWADAEKRRKALSEQFPDREFTATYSKELTPLEARKLDDDIMMSNGQIGFSKRGERLRGDGIEDLASVEDPMTSLNKSLQAVADRNTKGDVIEWLETQWKNTYSQTTRIGKENGGTKRNYPLSESEILDNIETPLLRGEAVKLFNKIETMKNSHLSKLADMQKSAFLKWAKSITKGGELNSWGRTKISNGLIMASNKPIESYLKSIPFWFYIAGNPTRQILLQSQQSLFVASMIPSYTLKALISDSHRLGIARQALRMKDPSKYLDPEFIELARQYEKTGIHQALSQSGIQAESNIRELAGVTKKTTIQKLSPLNIIKAPWILGKQGMLIGEAVHQRTAWLVARKLFIKEKGYNPTKRADWQGIAARTRQLALSMQAQSSFKYQKGVAGMITQFMGVQHKALAAMTVNPAYKGYKKWVNLSQGLVYGARAFPTIIPLLERHMNEAEMPIELRVAITGGMVDAMMYSLTGKYYDMSKSLAPAGGLGLSTYNLFEGFTGQFGKEWYNAVPVSGAFGSLYKFMFEKAPVIIGMGFNGRATDDTAKDFINNYARLSSGWSNFTQARASYNANELITRKGLPTDIVFDNPIDYVVRGAFGTKFKSEDEAWKAVEELGYNKTMSQGNLDTDAANYAKIYKEIMINGDTLLDNADNYQEVINNMMNDLSSLEAYIRWANKDYGEIIARDAVISVFRDNGSRISDIVKKMTKKIYSGSITDEKALEYVSRFKNLQGLKPETMTMTQDLLDQINFIKNKQDK